MTNNVLAGYTGSFKKLPTIIWTDLPAHSTDDAEYFEDWIQYFNDNGFFNGSDYDTIYYAIANPNSLCYVFGHVYMQPQYEHSIATTYSMFFQVSLSKIAHFGYIDGTFHYTAFTINDISALIELVYKTAVTCDYFVCSGVAKTSKFSVNAGEGGNTLLLMWSSHTSGKDYTMSGILMIRLGYNGDHITPVEMSFNSGNSSVTSYTTVFSLAIDDTTKKLKVVPNLSFPLKIKIIEVSSSV